MTKKFNEELAENYSKLYNINMIGLRFFTILEVGQARYVCYQILNQFF